MQSVSYWKINNSFQNTNNSRECEIELHHVIKGPELNNKLHKRQLENLYDSYLPCTFR